MASNFITLDFITILYLFLVGFVGGLVSGFIGSGGAFVLTPAMMSLGVPGIVAVASNICHKFPKALVGALKRAKYGQVDVKLGIVMGISAEAGVLYGAHIQEGIKRAFGDVGSNLYVSVAFVVVLAIVGGYVLRDAWRIYRSGNTGAAEKVGSLARKIQSIRIPGTMVYFKSMNAEVSVLFTIPMGFATGMLAATIAVGGFIGVPAMHYLLGVPSLMASASELVIAFVMGVGGTIKYAWSGLVDIRLAMIILAGSLFGIQLGAIGTTYVKPYMIKVVMGVIMMLVLVSRGLVIPVYLSDLDLITKIDPTWASVLKGVSFGIMIFALLTGALIVLHSLIKGMIAHRAEQANEATAMPSLTGQLSPMGRLERILLVSDGSEYSQGAAAEAIRLAKLSPATLHVLKVVPTSTGMETFGVETRQQEMTQAQTYLEAFRTQAVEAGVECTVEVRQAADIGRTIVQISEECHADLIVMGRRGKAGVILNLLVGNISKQVAGLARCAVLMVPRAAVIGQGSLLLAVDGSRHSDAAATAAYRFATMASKPVTVISVVHEDFNERRTTEMKGAVQRVTHLLDHQGVSAKGEVIRGRPVSGILDWARQKGTDLIVMGSRGHSGLENILLGSVSERVIGNADCAVLVVKG
ncbi:MAG: TSUP family transporter [Pseudomonadota bacterium]